LLDATLGASVFLRAKDGEARAIATLDLRIDYMKPATPHRDVIARAVCYAMTRNVAFVRGAAFHDDERDPIATAAATFMLDTKGQSALGRSR
jgi:acyl-coenzyme A thioesterase PaaI-like protein